MHRGQHTGNKSAPAPRKNMQRPVSGSALAAEVYQYRADLTPAGCIAAPPPTIQKNAGTFSKTIWTENRYSAWLARHYHSAGYIGNLSRLTSLSGNSGMISAHSWKRRLQRLIITKCKPSCPAQRPWQTFTFTMKSTQQPLENTEDLKNIKKAELSALAACCAP